MSVTIGQTVLRATVFYLLGVAFGGAVGVIATARHFEAAIDTQKIEAANLLATETNKVLQAERKQKELSNALETQHNAAKEQIQTEQAANRRLASELGGLRDKGRRKSSNCAMPGTGSTAGGAVEGTDEAYLSGEATEFLLGLTYDADEVATYAKTCHDWIISRQKLSPRRDKE